MICKGFSSDTYALHALGLADGSERDELKEHLRNHCGYCIAALKDALSFWNAFAQVAGRLYLQNVSGPSAGLRRRILRSIEPVSLRRAFIPAWTWNRAAAAAAIVFGISATV